jgi:hypothetical protein
MTYLVQHLPKLRILLFLLILSGSLSDCQSSVQWMIYNETYCSDKWTYDINNEKLKDNVVAYLKSNGVKVYEIEIFSDLTPETCTACTCKSGRRIKCKVPRRDVSAAKKQGFYEE